VSGAITHVRHNVAVSASQPSPESDPQPRRTRRTQAERSETTIGHITAAARNLFATKGFADTSIEDIVQSAGVTRGALYHHFTSKAEVFRAVVVAEVLELDQRSITAFTGVEDPWRMVELSGLEVLEYGSDPGVHRILFDDAGAVFGNRELRDIRGERALPFLRAAIEATMEAGEMRRRPVDPLIFMMYGAVRELCALVVRADDPERVLIESRAEVRALLAAIKAS